MKNRLRKLIFLKSFINIRPILILALILFIVSSFINYEFKKSEEARAGSYSYTENFTTVTYKDAVNTTGYWDIANNIATLSGGSFRSMDGTQFFDQLTNNPALTSGRPSMDLDPNNNPYIAYDENLGFDTFFTKWTPGIGWTDMDNNPGRSLVGHQFGPQIKLDKRNPANVIPYVAYNNAAGPSVIISKWTTGIGWTDMKGNLLPGYDILEAGLARSYSQQIQFDANGNPMVIWIGTGTPITDIKFSKWTPNALPAVCGAGITGCWTNMAGTIAGSERLDDAALDSVRLPNFEIDASYNPYILWETTTNNIYFTKWTPGTGWTKMSGVPGFEKISADPLVLISDSNNLALDTINNIPFIIWAQNNGGKNDLIFTKWTPGTGWTNMVGIPGLENVTAGLVSSSINPNDMALDSLNNPYIIFRYASPANDTYFTRWSSLTNNWVKMDGTPGFDNISNNPAVNGNEMYLEINSLDIPYVSWHEFPGGYVGDYFSKWTSGMGWTKLNGVQLGYNHVNYQPWRIWQHSVMQIGSDDNAYITWDAADAILSDADIFFAKGRLDFDTSSVLQSINVNSTTDYVTEAKLDRTEVLNGQTINYFLSNDGGATWESITPGSWHAFTSRGNDLRWRAELSTIDNFVTPAILDLSIGYQTKKIFCSLSPINQDVGGSITVNASVSFTPVAGSVQAEFEQNNVNYSTIILSNTGGSDYSGQLITDINHLGQNDVTVLATDSATGETYTCNPSVGDVWVKKSLQDIAWEPRRGHVALSFKGKLWVIGGLTNNDDYFNNEVWSSADGLNWTKVNTIIPWQARTNFSAAVFNNKIWVVGGLANTTGPVTYSLLNDVWSSSDGINWVQETASAPWSVRADFGLTVYNNELWITGGCATLVAGSGTCATTSNDVWHSANGSSWTQATASAAWTARLIYSLLTYDDGTGEKMWVIGGRNVPGTAVNDVWYSTNGIAWTLKTAGAAFPTRTAESSVVYNDGGGIKMWLMGGRVDVNTYYNDVWNSSDGLTWSLVSDPADAPVSDALPIKWTSWVPRYYLKSVVFNDGTGSKLWVLGGEGYDYKRINDVWSSPDGISWSLKGLNYGPPYGIRWDVPMVAFDPDGPGPLPKKMYIFGGLVKNPGHLASDVWATTDGVNWTCEAGSYTNAVQGINCANPAPPWSGRWGHKALVYDNKIWIIGGCKAMAGFTGACSAGNRLNDVWYSSDGVNWTQTTAAAPWTARYEPAVAVYNNKMWFAGGYNAAGGNFPKDVYSSTNGIAWTLETNTAAWPGRLGHQIATYNDGSGEKMYLMGGYTSGYLNDVWVSADGISWTQLTPSASWAGRLTFGGFNYNGQMLVFGGQATPDFLNDVYSSIDGTSWTEVTPAADWGPRDFFSSAIFNDRLWVGSGDRSSTYMDLWASTYDFLHFTAIQGSTPPSVGPSTPSDFYCEAIFPDTIRWHFTDTANNETGFRLYGPGGKILDTGDEITTNLDHFDETNLETNTEYVDRHVTAFNGSGESGASGTASCYTLAKVPTPPSIGYISATSMHLNIMPNDGNPPSTEYLIKEMNSGQYLKADGSFGVDLVWLDYKNWGGGNGIIVSGAPIDIVSGQVNMTLAPNTQYGFAVKARNGNYVETDFSEPTYSSTFSNPTTLSATKGVAINKSGLSVRSFIDKFFTRAWAATSQINESRYVVLLREFSVFINIILFVLLAYLFISLYSSIRYLRIRSKEKKYRSLIWSILTKEPALVFANNSDRDDNGTYKDSYQRHRAIHLASQKAFLRTIGLIILKFIILAVLIFGITGVNHFGSAQMSDFNESGVLVEVGDKLTYAIEIQNNDAMRASNNIVITDILDSHLSYISGSAKINDNKISAAVSETHVGQTLSLKLNFLPPSSSVTIIFSAQIRAGSEGAVITNIASGLTEDNVTFTTNAVSNPVGEAPLIQKYSCNTQNGSCFANSSGSYSSLSDCQSACKCAGPGLSAIVYGNGNCCAGLILEGGLCNPPRLARYSCNLTTGQCSVGYSGPYSNLASCQSACEATLPPCVGDECKVTPPPPPPPCTGPDCGTPPPCTGSGCGTVTPPPACTGPNCGTPPTPPGLTPIPIVNSIIEILVTPEAQKVTTNYITPALIAVAVMNTIPMAILLTSYLLPYLHLIFVEPLLFLFRKKRKKWGVVYNALSKVPVDLAVVRLFRKSDNTLVQTRVTDKNGRYILIVKESGEYYISVTKSGFVFPTKYLSSDKEDTKYIDLYHGEAVEVTAKDAAITANIPLDPAEKKIMPERQVIFGYLFKNLRLVISYVGLILATLIFLIYPTWITGISILLHIFLFTIFLRLIVPKKPKSWGIVYDQNTKEPLHYVIVRIFDIKFNKLLETQITDGKGRYSFLVSKNQYQLLAEKGGYQKKEIKPVDLVAKEEIVDLDMGMEKLKS